MHKRDDENDKIARDMGRKKFGDAQECRGVDIAATKASKTPLNGAIGIRIDAALRVRMRDGLAGRTRQGYWADALPFPDVSGHLCEMTKLATNAPEFTVGELAGALKRTIEENFGLRPPARRNLELSRSAFPPATPISA